MKLPILQFVEGVTLVEGRTLPPVGAQVRVNYRIKEGEKERIQAFEGTVIRHHDGDKSMNATFTVRKMSQGFGVERIFPLHSPLVESIKVNRMGRVRRGKLYFLRERAGKKARLRAETRESGPGGTGDAGEGAGEAKGA
jgi:large subunit ribosomal protein L19